MDQAFRPKKNFKKVWCLSTEPSKKISFINKIKVLIKKAKEVYKLWKTQDFSISYPRGLFAPNFPKIANLSPQFF